MQVTIIIYEDAHSFNMRTDPHHQMAYWSGTMAYLEKLKSAGIFVGGAGLELPHTATTISFKDGKTLVQDGPSIDSKEQLGGIFIINVENFDEAVKWASEFPQRPGTLIEVRPNLPKDR